MKSTKLIITLLILALLTIQSCKVLKEGQNLSEKQLGQVFIFQNNSESLISGSSQTLHIERTNFSIRFFNKRYNSDKQAFFSARIAVFLEKEELAKIKVGMEANAISCFEPGTGLAASPDNGYEYLYFTNDAHHYLFYEDGNSNRLKLLQDYGEYLKLEFPVSALSLAEEQKMEDSSLKEFYLVIFIDRDLDGVIDKGELNKLNLKID